MTQSKPKLISKFLSRIDKISSAEWNELVGDSYPFMKHEFLNALELSGSASDESGWTPNHLTVRDGEGKLLAVAPAYLKSHSYGEYVFDWSWANAYQQNRIRYYPKLLTAIPFTPCTGPRIKVLEGEHTAEIYDYCIQTMINFCETSRLSSWHMLFPQEAEENIEIQSVMRQHLMKRSGVQYHWYNDDFGSFADYLGAMKARKRNSIRKEREKVQKQSITFEHINGRDIAPEQVQDFYIFYHATYMKRGSYGYLNQDFFEQLVETMPEQLLFVFAQKAGTNIAAALFFIGEDTLFGRYWGCLDEYDQLHFETCFYQGIDYCIENKLQHIDAGAQGEHKIQRGFRPIETTSWHWISHPSFEEAIQDFLDQEGPQIQEYIDEAQKYLPFKQSNS